MATGTAVSRNLCVAIVVTFAWGAHAFEWGSVFTAGGSSEMGRHATDDLNPESLEKHLQENPVTAILFYAPWCFYSQQAMPAWDTASQKLALHDPPVKLAKINTHRYGVVGDKYGVNAFPMMKLFSDGSVFEFDPRQGRGWQQIVKWVNHHIDRDHILKDAEDADAFLHDNELAVIGLFEDGHNSSLFEKSTRHFEDVMFAEARGNEMSKQVADHISTHASLVCETMSVGKSPQNQMSLPLPRESMRCEDAPRNPQREEWTDKFAMSVEGKAVTVRRTDITGGWDQMLQIKCCDEDNAANKERHKVPVPSIVMLFPHDERFAIFDGDIYDTHKVDRWIQAHRTPMIFRLTMETAEKIFEGGSEKSPILFLISQGSEPVLEKELTEAAKLLRGRAVVCLSGVSSMIERRLAGLAGVEEGQREPVLALIEAHAGEGGPFHTAKKFRLPTAGLQAKQVVKFVSDYESGSLTPFLKSEPEPTAEDLDGPVGVLVGTTFTKGSSDTTKDVLVDFYAPWCGHCRKFEPIYKELAKRLQHVPTLKIMKIDATRNEIEGMQIAGFPTIMLFPAGTSGHQVMYQGERSPEAITQWLHGHCAEKFDDRPPPKAKVPTEETESGLLDPSEEDL